MSDGVKAWHDDMDEYVGLCKKYNEKVQYSGQWPDCLSEHHQRLRDRNDGRPEPPLQQELDFEGKEEEEITAPAGPVVSETLKNNFITWFEEMSRVAHDVNIKNGFTDPQQPRNEYELIALTHSELSECLEAIRNDIAKDDKIPSFSGAEAELADVIIRIMNHAGERKYRLAEAIAEKINFNATRGYKHGGKKA